MQVCNVKTQMKQENEIKKTFKFKLESIRVSISRPEVICKKGALENFAKFTRKHLCQSLFFNKVAGLKQSLEAYAKKTYKTRQLSAP